MEEADTTPPLCLSIINKCGRRKRHNYRKLNGVVMNTYTDDKVLNVKTHQRFWKINVIPAELMKKFRDAYVEMMVCFARHVSQLNKSSHFYLLERVDPDSHQDHYFSQLNEKV